MNVLHLADTPLSGAPYRLMQVQRIGGMDARLISHRNYYSSSSPVFYEADILLQDDQGAKRNVQPSFDRSEIRALFRDADVFHFHNYYLDQRIFKLFPELKEYLKGKKIVFQVHSPRNSIRGVEDAIRDKTIHEHLVVAQYQTRQFPQFCVVPNAVPIHDHYHTPILNTNPDPVICYSPSNTNLRDWNNKGHGVVINAVKRLRIPHKFLEITHTPHRECLRLKQKADIAIDEVVTGSYHMCTLEALSMGQIAIANVDELCENAVKEVTGGVMFPHYKGTDLTAILDSLLTCGEDNLRYEKERSRLFMEEYWNEQRLTQIFREIYER